MRGALDTIIRAFWGMLDAGDAALWRTQQALRRARHQVVLRWDAPLAALAEARDRPDAVSRTPRRVAVAALLCTAAATALLISGGGPSGDSNAASQAAAAGTALADGDSGAGPFADDASVPAAGRAAEVSKGAGKAGSRPPGGLAGPDSSVPAADVPPAGQELGVREHSPPSAPAPRSRRESRIAPSPRTKARAPRVRTTEPAPAPQVAPAPPPAPVPAGPAPEDDEREDSGDDDDGDDGRGNGHGHGHGHHDDDDDD